MAILRFWATWLTMGILTPVSTSRRPIRMVLQSLLRRLLALLTYNTAYVDVSTDPGWKTGMLAVTRSFRSTSDSVFSSAPRRLMPSIILIGARQHWIQRTLRL